MNWTSIRPWLGTVARLVLGVTFLVAGWQKLEDPRAFLRAIRAYDATPEWLSKAIAYGLPTLEVCLAILLIVGVITRLAAAAVGVLLVVFLIGIIQAAARGIKLECGCFGGGGTTDHTTYLLDILRDVGLLALVVFLVIWPMTRISVDEFLARNDNVEMPSAKRMRTEQGARKYNAMLEARKQEARVRTRYLTVSLVMVVLLISFIGIGVQSNRAKITTGTETLNVSSVNGVQLGSPTAAVKIDIFADFQCPFCQQFAQDAGADINALIASKDVLVRYHMVSFLDSSSSGNRYSSRAANAAFCAADINPETFQKYHDYLYSVVDGVPIQPTEGSNGRTDADLESYAKAIGIDGDQLTTFQTCVTTEQHKGVVQATTDNWSKRGFTSTPVVLVNGKKVDNPSKATLDAAVKAASATATAGATATGPATIVPNTPSSSASGASGAATGTSAAVATVTPTASP